MKRLLFLCLALPLALTSCSTEEAQKVADEFHDKLNKGDIDYIVDKMLVPDLSTEEEQGFRDFLSAMHDKGKHENRSKSTGFNKSYKNGVTKVKLEYTFEVGGEEVYEALVLADQGDGYKILAVSMHPDKDVVDAFVEDYK